MRAIASYTAIGLLVAGAAAAGSGDYVLVTPTERICAKSLANCEMAREAIRKGWWPIAERDAATVCEPRPACFSERSNCIAGYSC